MAQEPGSLAIFKETLHCRKHTRWAKTSVDIDRDKKVKEQNSMKKLTAILLSALLVLSLAACGNNNQNAAEDTPAETVAPTTEPDESSITEENTEESANDETENTETLDTAEAGNGNILVAYFSVMETDGVDTVAGASRVAVDGEVLGNNEYIAQIIQRETGGNLFAIETVQDYPTTHDPLLEFAYNEKADNARPELATQIENPDSYDVIFLGYPNWNADLPMPLYTFLEEYDFSGKTIIPFTTHGGSGFSRTIQTISELQPNATVISDGLSISRNSVSGAESDVVDWVNSLNLTAE
jgi:flavodoxin